MRWTSSAGGSLEETDYSLKLLFIQRINCLELKVLKLTFRLHLGHISLSGSLRNFPFKQRQGEGQTGKMTIISDVRGIHQVVGWGWGGVGAGYLCFLCHVWKAQQWLG